MYYQKGVWREVYGLGEWAAPPGLVLDAPLEPEGGATEAPSD